MDEMQETPVVQEPEETDAALPGSEPVLDLGPGPDSASGLEPEPLATKDESALLMQEILDSVRETRSQVRCIVDKDLERIKRDIEVIQQLNDEVVKYRQGIDLKLKSPLLMELARLCDSMEATLDACRASGEESLPCSTLEAFAASAADILEGEGVERRTPETGDRFDSATAQLAGRVKTGDASLTGTIAQVKGNTYFFEGKAIGKAMVSVFAFDASQAPPSGEALQAR